jgi:murein DD-endopeptidase MepM/ murein hydrolase activator NlpD
MFCACHSCGVQVDPARATARVVAARVVTLCGACARGERLPSQAPPMAVALSGELERAKDPPTVQMRVPRQPSRTARWTMPLMIAVGLCASSPRPEGARGLPADWLTEPALAGAQPAPPPPIVTTAPRPARAEHARLVHPLAGKKRELPENGSRRFGAERGWGRGKEMGCGNGHCGVDIGVEIGRPILSVADGVVATVVRYDNDRGGLYVRVDHEDGTSTHYFHLHEIREDLRKGMHVRAGEQIATLGRSGIKNGPAHLHFGLSFRDIEQVEGDPQWIDPEPMLREAEVLEKPVAP